MIDILILVVIGLVTWCVASEGAWGAAFALISVLAGGFVAMNFFEPLADALQANIANSYEWSHRWDIICFLGLFAGVVFGLRTLAEKIQPVDLEVHAMVYDISRWALAGLTGYVMAAFLLTALHTAPLPRNFLGFRPERHNLLGVMSPDYQWLGFTQYATERALGQGGTFGFFDGDQFPRVEGNVGTTQVWPTFPIRYATRREQYSMSGGVGIHSPTAPIDPTAAPTTPPPKRGGGGGRSIGF